MPVVPEVFTTLLIPIDCDSTDWVMPLIVIVCDTPLLDPDRVTPLPPARIKRPPTVAVSPAVFPMFDRPAENCVPVWLNARIVTVPEAPFRLCERVMLLPPASRNLTWPPDAIPVVPDV